jgi:hypothetical protein
VQPPGSTSTGGTFGSPGVDPAGVAPAPGPVVPGLGAPGAASPGAPASCTAIEPGASPLRRLNRFEYDNTVRDLLGEDMRLAVASFPAEEEVLGFNNNADSLGITPLLAEGYAEAAETLAGRAVANLPKLMGCDATKPGTTPAAQDACARSFVEGFGRRAYRRPLVPDEVSKLLAIYQASKGPFGFKTAVQNLLEAFLQSSAFFYRVETGLPVTGNTKLRRLSSWETASRLSYLVWASMPDDTLFVAAAANRLGTAEEIKAQAMRMLADPKARAVTGDFADQWLGIPEIRHVGKDKALFPTFSADIAKLMGDEVARFFDHVVWEGSGDLATLLTASYSFQNQRLAQYYGEATATGDALQRVNLDPSRRSGLLTLGGVMAALAVPYETSPIIRGKYVRARMLCQVLPDPPPEVMASPPKPNPNLTTRERFAQHSADPACAVCHDMLDPLGLGFENFDAAGRWRTTDVGKPVNASGKLSSADVAGPFVGAAELTKKLASSRQVKACVTKQLFRFGYGRGETDRDACNLDLLDRAFESSGGKVQALVLALTQTPAFLYRPALEGVSP